MSGGRISKVPVHCVDRRFPLQRQGQILNRRINHTVIIHTGTVDLPVCYPTLMIDSETVIDNSLPLPVKPTDSCGI